MSLESIGDKIKGYLPAAAQIATVAATVAKVIPGIGNVVSAIELGIKIANGVANEIPQAVKVWNDVQAAANGGQPVTEDEWAQWKADIDEAHAGFLAAAARVQAKG
jgi:hypothetical protein